MPVADQKAALQTQIEACCRRFGVPPFEPHVTLFSGALRQPSAAATMLAELARRGRPLDLAVEGLRHSPLFFKTLFLALATSEAVTALAGEAREIFDPESNHVLQPHLSLLYKEMAAPAREVLVAKTPMLFRQLHCDRLALVSPGMDWRDREAWRILARHRLGAI